MRKDKFYAKTIFSFLFLLAFATFSQETKQDSVNFYLKNAKGANKFLFLKRAVLISEELKNDSLIKKTTLEYAKECYFSKDTLGLNFSANKLLKHFKLQKDSSCLAKAYHLKALNHKIKNNLDSTYFYYQESKNIYIPLKDSIEIGRRLLSMAILQVKELDYLGCQITAIEGLKYIEPTKEYRTLISLYQTLGNALGHLQRPEEARDYYIKAQEIVKFNTIKSRRERNYLNLLSNIGITYKDQGDFNKAIAHYKEGLRFDSLEIKHVTQYQNLLGNLSTVYFKQGNINKAIKGYKTVLKSRIKSKNLYAQSVSHSLLAEAFLENKQYNLAAKHAKIGLKLAKETRNNEQVLECLKFLSDLNTGKVAKKYLETYIQLNDSLFTRERNLKNQFAKIRYETDKKDKENTSLKLLNDKNLLELESEKQQKTIGWLFAGAGILFIGFGGSVVVNRKKKLLFKAKMQQIEAREKERQQIAKSLHDEVAGDIRMLHLKLSKTNQVEEAKSLNFIKENVRNLSHQLSSESFDKVSFKNQIINLVSDYFEIDFKIKILAIDGVLWKSINNAIKRVLFLSIRESIENAKKHAVASKVILNFSETKKTISLIITDNGTGIDIKKPKKGIGLKNMRERIEEANGIFSIESTPNKGTKISIEIPKNGR